MAGAPGSGIVREESDTALEVGPAACVLACRVTPATADQRLVGDRCPDSRVSSKPVTQILSGGQADIKPGGVSTPLGRCWAGARCTGSFSSRAMANPLTTASPKRWHPAASASVDRTRFVRASCIGVSNRPKLRHSVSSPSQRGGDCAIRVRLAAVAERSRWCLTGGCTGRPPARS